PSDLGGGFDAAYAHRSGFDEDGASIRPKAKADSCAYAALSLNSAQLQEAFTMFPNFKRIALCVSVDLLTLFGAWGFGLRARPSAQTVSSTASIDPLVLKTFQWR